MNIQVFDNDLSEDALEHYLASERVAIGIKTTGPVPARDRLCLVQLCSPDKVSSIIKIGKAQHEAPQLEELFNASSVQKIFYHARLDIAHLYSQLDVGVNNIFCVKIASKLARTYANSHDLESVAHELEGVKLDDTPLDWGEVENFSDGRLSRVAKNVHHLCAIQEKLQVMLEREDYWDLAKDAFDVVGVMISLDLLQFGDIFS